MIPVDITSTCSAAAPIRSAVSAAISRTSCQPLVPVQALALPELTTTARTPPLGVIAASHSTGAAR